MKYKLYTFFLIRKDRGGLTKCPVGLTTMIDCLRETAIPEKISCLNRFIIKNNIIQFWMIPVLMQTHIKTDS